MKFPKEIRDLADRLTREKVAKKKEERAKQKAREAVALTARKERIQKGVADAEKIFAWADEFRHDKTGRRIMKLGTRSFLNGVMFFDDTLKGFAFQGLGISMDGLWSIRSGCGSYPRNMESPEELAGEIEPEILAAAVASIESGRVWETIKKRWEINM